MVRIPLLFAILTGLTLGTLAVKAADLTVTVTQTRPTADSEVKIRTTLANFLALELTRVTFDVLPTDQVQGDVERKLVGWGGNGPSEAEAAEIYRQLLAEGSYYLTSLSYLIKAGGAVFPEDKPEPTYAGDTLVRLDVLQRRLADGLMAGGDVSDVLIEAEHIRALTEGYA
ncbi:MAG: hypothetical protein EOP18_13625, partial [Rhizobiaceae bacterium]